jgi:predicted  nucleic acid-binding Zn-ribbon protein
MSLEEAVRSTVEGLVGKLLLGSAFAIIMGVSGLAYHELSGLHSDIADHSSKLSAISQKIDDLILSNDVRARSADAAIDKLTGDSQQHAIAIARAETEIEELKNAAPRIERETMIEAPRIPSPLPQIGAALSHIFPSFPGHRRHGRGRR